MQQVSESNIYRTRLCVYPPLIPKGGAVCLLISQEAAFILHFHSLGLHRLVKCEAPVCIMTMRQNWLTALTLGVIQQIQCPDRFSGGTAVLSCMRLQIELLISYVWTHTSILLRPYTHTHTCVYVHTIYIYIIYTNTHMHNVHAYTCVFAWVVHRRFKDFFYFFFAFVTVTSVMKI